MTAGMVVARLIVVAVICGGDPMPRSGPGGLPL